MRSRARARGQTRMLAELVDDETGRLDPVAWRAAHAQRSPVARCGCGALVLTDPGPEYQVFSGVRWYAMRCLSCGAETSLPAGRQLETEVRRPSLAHATARRDLDEVLTGDR
jgi:hypothetical protein